MVSRRRRAPFRVVTAEEVARRLALEPPPLIVDARRRAAFSQRPEAIPGAVAVVLDDRPARLPAAPRQRPVVVYCLCHGETSSSRVALWLAEEGYRDVSVLGGGLDAWKRTGHRLEPIAIEQSQATVAWIPHALETPRPQAADRRLDDPFLSLLAGHRMEELPQRRHMAVVFVDMVDSTSLLTRHSAEKMLELVQAFMEIVVDVGTLHCGDVHDFEGDGALLYFAGLGEALPAAFEVREQLLARRRELTLLPWPRLSLDAGPLVVGVVGGRFRRSVALVGPSVPRAARILKLAPPGGIIATQTVVQLASETSPDLARRFVPFPTRAPLEGMEDEMPSLFLVPQGA